MQIYMHFNSVSVFVCASAVNKPYRIKIILFVIMPVLSGQKTLHAMFLRNEKNNLKVIILSF